jgi:hypothetical protein
MDAGHEVENADVGQSVGNEVSPVDNQYKRSEEPYIETVSRGASLNNADVGTGRVQQARNEGANNFGAAGEGGPSAAAGRITPLECRLT